MTVIRSTQMKEAVLMSDQVAKEDITEVNDLGQTVVVVAKGQPIPEHLLPKKSAAKKVDGPAEDKARKAPASAKRKK